MKQSVLRACARLLAFTLMLPFCAPAQTAPAGAIRGTVVNDATGNFVEGAVLTLAGTNRSAVTDSQGRFHFGSLPAGDYRVRAESAGNATGEMLVAVGPGATATTTLRLGSEIVAMEKLMVTAQAEGQSQALNVQKNAENIRKVVSQDALANSRLGEVGEVLQALPGLYLEISTRRLSAYANVKNLTDAPKITYQGNRSNPTGVRYYDFSVNFGVTRDF